MGIVGTKAVLCWDSKRWMAGFTPTNLAFLLPSQAAKNARGPAAAIKTRPGEKTHEPVRHHHRRARRRQERTRDLDDPRDLVAPYSVSGAGLFPGLSRAR